LNSSISNRLTRSLRYLTIMCSLYMVMQLPMMRQPLIMEQSIILLLRVWHLQRACSLNNRKKSNRTIRKLFQEEILLIFSWRRIEI
jgi:hypothetical protein